jgi:hypothetical protein
MAEMFFSISTMVLLLSNLVTIAASQNIPLTPNSDRWYIAPSDYELPLQEPSLAFIPLQET